MGTKDLFLTRQTANDGVKLYLIDPRTGEETKHWLLVIGRDSDVSRKAELEAERNLRKRFDGISPKDKAGIREVQEQIEREAPERVIEAIATLIIDWSWHDEEPCTRENVIAFLKDAPQIADQVDTFTSNRVLFFGRAAKTSSPSPKQTSDSTAADQDQTGPVATT